MMNKELLNELKQKLEKEKIALEKELKSFADKDKELKDDWDTRFPNFGEGSSSFDLEKEADEVEKYATLLPIEYVLEVKLRDVNSALEKIEQNKDYGKCEKCQKEIGEKMLVVSPETKLCLKCKTNK